MRERPSAAPLRLVASAVTATILLGASPSHGAPPAAPAQHRPNILVVMTDDQSHDTLTDEYMPRTKALIADQGLTCTQAYMPTALCGPSRASFLTGRYAHHHGVHVNDDRLSGPTVADRLHDAGYETALIGKYLNSWDGRPRPEYDFWAAWMNGYTNALMDVQGRVANVPGYQTHVLRDYALRFLRNVPDDKPFALFFTPHAPHAPATPAPGDERLYSDAPRWRPPNFNPPDMPGAPLELAERPLLTNEEIRDNVDEFRAKQLACLRSIDEAVGEITDLLRDQGKLDDTFIVFYSDNGFFWGEHRLLHKNRVYEEASHVPFAIRYPPLVATPRTETRLVANIDLAPTMLDLAGVPVPPDMDGRSLVPLCRNEGTWRDALLLEGWPEHDNRVGYRGLRTDHYVYAENDGDLPELYDLSLDPYQMKNLAAEPDEADLVARLHDRLASGDY